MTAPLSTGFPDWARQQSEAQVLEINDINVPIAHNFGYGTKYVGNARALQLWANPPTHGMRLQFQYFADSLGVIIMDSYVVNLQANDVVKQSIPILGPYVNVVVQHSNAATNTVTIQLWRTPELARFAGLEGDIAVFSTIGAAVGASSTVTLDAQYVMEGPAVWTAFSASTSWELNIDAVDYLGNVTFLDAFLGGANSGVNHFLYLPPWHIRATMQNSGVATTFSLMMTRRHNI